MAALRPLRAITEPAGWVAAPHRYRPPTGVRAARRCSHLVGHGLALEDVTAGEPDAGLDVGGAEDLVVGHAVTDVGGELGQGVQDQPGDLVPAAVPAALGQAVGGVLGEHADHVAARRGHRRVVGGLEVDLGEADVGHAPLGVGEGLLGGVQAAGHVDHGPVGLEPGGGREAGQPVQGGVQLHHRRAQLPAVHPGPVVAGHDRRVEQVQGPHRVGVGDDRGRPEQLAALQPHPFPGQDLGHRDPAGQLGAQVEGGLGDGEGDPAHATLDIAPQRALAPQVALVVHELDGGGARVPGAGPGADDPLAVEGVLHPLVAHVAVEGVGDRLLEQHRDQLVVVAQALLQLGPGGRLALPGVALGPGAQPPAQPVEHVLIGQHPLDVALGEAVGAQVGHGLVVVDELGQGGAVGERDHRLGSATNTR
jgi:hypothetical protein